MNDCCLCPSEKECRYPYKPCECVGQRKFWDDARRKEWDDAEAKKKDLVYERGDICGNS